MLTARITMLGGLSCLLLSAACSNPREVADLKAQVSQLSEQVETLSGELKEFKRSQDNQTFLRDTEGVAYLTPGSDGYSVLQTDFGRMPVSLANVEPYANGSRVTLTFGNLTSATVNSPKATIEWGSLDERGLPRNEDQRSRNFTFTQSLRGGAWTDVSIVLEAVPPTALGFVRIKDFGHGGIFLRR